jgi:hypothetical protein
MYPIRASENSRFANQLSHLHQFNQFISEVASAIVASNDEFERVWNIANQVYERHCSPKVAFIAEAGRDHSETTALSA